MKQRYLQLIFLECTQDMQNLNRWSVELMSSNETDLGGFKEVVFMIKGNGAYSKLKI